MGALIGAAGLFVTTTVAMSRLADSVIIAAVCAGGALLVAITSGRSSSKLLAADRNALLRAAAGGVATFMAAPLIALSQRASDAPPGSEVLFFTTTAWGLVLLAGTAAVRRTGFASITGAAMASLGGAALLASWERPSSFSPFVRFADRELGMLLAGVVFVAGALAIHASLGALGRRRAALVATASAATAALIVALPGIVSGTGALQSSAGLLVALALMGGLYAVSAIRLLDSFGPGSVGAVLLAVPAALTGLTFIERAISIAGPDPIVWPSAIAGMALTFLGIVALCFMRLLPDGEARSAHSSFKPVVFGSIVAVAVAIGTLFTGAMAAEVTGAFGDTYHASWTMIGAETGAGWLPVVLALLVFGAAWQLQRTRYRAAAVGSIAALFGITTYPWLASLPLRTATRWIPADVQQTYGTEYARLTFEPLHEPLRLIILALVAALAVSVLLIAWRARTVGQASEGVS